MASRTECALHNPTFSIETPLGYGPSRTRDNPGPSEAFKPGAAVDVRGRSARLDDREMPLWAAQATEQFRRFRATLWVIR